MFAPVPGRFLGTCWELRSAGVAAGIYRDVEEAAASRPSTEQFSPYLSVDRRERAYARWLDAVARVRNG